MKKIICILISINILIFLTGCSTISNRESIPEISHLTNKMEKAWVNIKTCKSEIALSMEIKAGSSKNNQINMKSTMKTFTDLKNKKMHMTSDMKFFAGTLSKENKQEVFLIDNTVYFCENKSRKISNWKSKKLSDMDTDLIWAEHNNMVSGGNLKDAIIKLPAKIESIEKHSGSKCYKLKIVSDNLEPGNEIFNSNNITDSLIGDIPYKIDNLNILIWIDIETFLIREYRINAKVTVDDGSLKSKGNITQVFRIWYNGNFNISLPDGISN